MILNSALFLYRLCILRIISTLGLIFVVIMLLSSCASTNKNSASRHKATSKNPIKTSVVKESNNKKILPKTKAKVDNKGKNSQTQSKVKIKGPKKKSLFSWIISIFHSKKSDTTKSANKNKQVTSKKYADTTESHLVENKIVSKNKASKIIYEPNKAYSYNSIKRKNHIKYVVMKIPKIKLQSYNNLDNKPLNILNPKIKSALHLGPSNHSAKSLKAHNTMHKKHSLHSKVNKKKK